MLVLYSSSMIQTLPRSVTVNKWVILVNKFIEKYLYTSEGKEKDMI